MDNWIERGARRKKNLAKANELWQAIQTSIEGVCKSFNGEHADVGSVELSPQNGHSLLIEVSHEQNKSVAMDTKRRVRITFDETSSQVRFTIDEHEARHVKIDADQERCFLKAGLKEITPDQFSELALKDALFTPRNPHRPGSPPPKVGVWS